MKDLWRSGFLGLLLLSLACEAEDPASAPPRSLATSATASPAEATPRLASKLRVEGGLVWVDQEAADPRGTLWELSEQAGFLLDITDFDLSPITLRFEGAALHDVVATLARGVPFALDYEPDDASGRHRVASVRVGTAAEAGALLVRRPARPRARRPEPRAERPSPDHERLLRALEIANLDARRELVEELEATGVQLDVLSHIMETDPDSDLRSIAADTLASSGNYGAVRNLIASLGSDDPAVLLLAIDALEFAGDETVVAELAHLLEHPDREVREAAREAREFLR